MASLWDSVDVFGRMDEARHGNVGQRTPGVKFPPRLYLRLTQLSPIILSLSTEQGASSDGWRER